jgi:hypothetical protein
MALAAAALLASATAPGAPEVAWAPHPGSQTYFVTSPVFETLYEGTRGPGKTNALLMDFCQHVGQGFGTAWRGILFRRSYPALADVVTKAKEWIPKAFPGAKFIESGPSGYQWRFPEGETLLFRYIEKKSDYQTYHGHEYPWVGFDELTMWESADCYNVMKSCCRSSALGLPRKYRATTNPHGPGHHWVKSRFIDPAARGVIVTDDDGNRRVTLHGHWSENSSLMAADPEYVARMLQATEDDPDQRAAWVDGSWDVSAGAFFGGAWSTPVHVLPAFSIPAGWTLDRSFDWGSSKPFSVGWWAESDGSPALIPNPATGATEQRTFARGTLVRVAEWYGCQPNKPNVGLKMESPEIAAGILERERDLFPGRRVHPGPADSSIFDVQDGHCIADSFKKAGVTWVAANKGPGSRKNGWALMRERMGHAKRTPREKAGLFVVATCRDFIRTVPVLPRDEKKPDDIDTSAEDHIADEVRYRILAPARPKATVHSHDL